MGHIEQVNIFPNRPLNIIQEADKAKSPQTAVDKQINITFLCRGSFSIGAKQYGFLNPIPHKDGANTALNCGNV